VKASHGLTTNFLFLMASNVLSPVFSMVLVLAISHLQGVEMLGKYSLVMTVFIVGQSCATLGLSIIITREVSKTPQLAGHYFLNACALTGALIALALVALVPGVSALLHDAEMRVAIALTLLSLLPSVPMAYGEAVLLAFGRAGDYVTVGLAENVARAGIGTLLVFAGYDVAAIAAALLAMRILASIALVLVLRHRGVAFAAHFDRTLWRDLIAQVPILGSIPIVNQIYARSDILLLTSLGSWRDVGLYSAGLRLIDLARTLPMAYSKAIYPILSRLYGQRGDDFSAASRRFVRHGLLLVTPLTVVLCGCSPVLITAFYGPSVAGGEPSLAMLSWTLIPHTIACVLAQALFAAGRQAIDLRVNIISTVLSIAANVTLIPWFGATGAAMAMLLSMSVYASLQYFWTKHHVVDPRAIDCVAKTAAATLVGTAVTAALLRANPIVAVAAGLAVYGAAIVAAGLVTREELDGWRTQIESVRARYLWGVR
jgi:O-antigen/teichoic acid export membrane protein